MAVDTVKLSHNLNSEVGEKILNCMLLRQCFDLKEGSEVYTFTNRQLEGTYDSNISVVIRPQDNEYDLTVECSLHKIIVGHNVYGGSDDLLKQVTYLHDLLERAFDVSFEFKPRDWILHRIDLADVFELPSAEAVIEYIRGLQNAEYPRRRVQRYSDESITAYGSTTGIKFYNKGCEFYRHDRKRLRKILSDEELYNLQNRANKILRVEVEIKSRKIKEMFYGSYPSIKNVIDRYDELLDLKETEIKKFLKEGVLDMNKYNNAKTVSQVLKLKYKNRLAGQLIGTWYQLSTFGEKYVRKNMNKATFYRQRKLLIESGCSWRGTDVKLHKNTKKFVPDDFHLTGIISMHWFRSMSKCHLQFKKAIVQKISFCMRLFASKGILYKHTIIDCNDKLSDQKNRCSQLYKIRNKSFVRLLICLC